MSSKTVVCNAANPQSCRHSYRRFGRYLCDDTRACLEKIKYGRLMSE